MSRLMEHVEVLTSRIGPRPVSTEEEHAAACYVSQELADLGLTPEMDEFTTPQGTAWPFALAWLLAIAGTVVSGLTVVHALRGQATTLFSIGLVLLLAAAAIFFTEHFGHPLLSGAFNKGVSQNVVAKYVPSSLAREKRRRKFIVVAHLDTTRAQLQAGPKLVNIWPTFRRVLYWVMVALPAVFVLRLLPIPWPARVDLVLWIASCVACLVPLFACVVVLANKFMPYTEGANCNASGVAVMLEVARRVLDPEMRERFAKESAAPAPVVEVEEGAAPVETFAPVVPIIAGEEAVREAGLVPEGAELEYVDEPAATGEGEQAFDPFAPSSEEAPAAAEEPAPAASAGNLAVKIPVIGSSTTGQLEIVEPAAAPAPEPAFTPVAASERRAPTARRAGEGFVPTAAVEDRAPVFSGVTQAAAVTSAFAPVAKPAVPTAAAEAASVGATSSFPTLGGTANIRSPRTGSDPFAPSAPAPVQLAASDIAAPESFNLFAPEPVQINAPKSRWRDALDGAHDAISKRVHKKTPARNQRDADFTGSWSAAGEDDDFGWKGGSYYNPEVFEAARARAAQIRESVIAMTEHDLLDKEVWFVGVGASAANQRGMKNFLELHASELRGALILNLEGVGAGELCYVDIEGAGRPQRADRRLQKLVRRVSRGMGEELSAETLTWRDTCATPAQRAGLRAMTLMAFDGVAPTAWRQAADTADRVEESNLEQATTLVLKMIENS